MNGKLWIYVVLAVSWVHCRGEEEIRENINRESVGNNAELSSLSGTPEENGNTEKKDSDTEENRIGVVHISRKRLPSVNVGKVSTSHSESSEVQRRTDELGSGPQSFSLDTGVGSVDTGDTNLDMDTLGTAMSTQDTFPEAGAVGMSMSMATDTSGTETESSTATEMSMSMDTGSDTGSDTEYPPALGEEIPPTPPPFGFGSVPTEGSMSLPTAPAPTPLDSFASPPTLEQPSSGTLMSFPGTDSTQSFSMSDPTPSPKKHKKSKTESPVSYGATTYAPVPYETFTYPTARPSVKFIAPTPHPTESSQEEDVDFPGEPEVIKEVETDKELQILLGIVAGLGVVGMLFTAYQVMENPDGLCASICRLSIKCVVCLYKVLCLPCRFMCGNAGKPTHMPAPTLDAMEMPPRREEML